MKGVFVNWTRPYLERKRLRGHAFKIYRDSDSEEYTTPDHEILYTIMSASYWKKFNGPTKLYTDKAGYDHYKRNNLLDLFDEIDIDTLEKYDYVDGGQFWTSGKSYCIGIEKVPFVFMDLDFVVKQKLPDWVFESEITIPHWEIPRGHYYPSRDQYKEIKHWQPPDNFHYEMLVPNTSFLYINNEEVQKEYLRTHLESVNTKDIVPEWFWLLTDQGLFGQALRNLNIKPVTLTDKVFLSDSEGYEDKLVGEASMFFYPIKHDISKDTLNWWHVWFRKIYYNLDEKFRMDDCKMIYKEIRDYLPEYSHFLNNDRLKQYDN